MDATIQKLSFRSIALAGKGIILVCALAAQLCAVSAARADDARKIVDDAELAFAQRNYEGALALLTRAKQQDPSWHEIDFNLGVTAEASGKYDLAVVHYQTYAKTLSTADAREIQAHASELAAFRQKSAERGATRRRFPWWGWTILGGAALVVVVGAAVAATGSTGEEY